MGNPTTTQELIDFAKTSMEKTGYSAEYISALSSTWNALKQYMSGKGILHFSAVTGIAFLQDQYNIRLDYFYCKLSKVDKRRKRAILVLNNCLEHESLAVPKSYSLCKFAPQFEKPFQKLIDVRMRAGLSMAAINRDIHCLNKLSNYLDGLNIQLLEELESVHVMGFMKSLSVAGKLPTLDGVASSLRILLEFLSSEHYVSKDLSQFVPKIKSKFDGIPSAYTKNEVQQLIDGVDRTGPKGKRDYAMILLAARLGMRASDICGLTFDNLKWQTNTIEFIVKKTGTRAILPLLNEVGEAIIEHIKYGRPTSADKHVFLRMETPFGEITPASLHGIVSKGLRNANIPLLPGKRHGPHALRASLASAMLDQHTPLPVISEALTHANSDTTRIYLKIDLQHLREYSLEVPPLGNVWLGGVAR